MPSHIIDSTISRGGPLNSINALKPRYGTECVYIHVALNKHNIETSHVRVSGSHNECI